MNGTQGLGGMAAPQEGVSKLRRRSPLVALRPRDSLTNAASGTGPIYSFSHKSNRPDSAVDSSPQLISQRAVPGVQPSQAP